MPSAFREPKNLPQWVELDYYRRPGWLRRWRWWLTALTLLVGTGVLVAFAWTPWAARTYQAGPVSAAHAFFNDQCGKCHTEAFQTARRFWPFGGVVLSVPDSACLECHRDQPAHHPEQVLEQGHCADCHQEHRGREVLARLPDATCTACHADLKDHSRYPDKCPFVNVSRFPDSHPDFLPLVKDKGHPVDDQGKDRGQLRFNHAKHLAEEGVFVFDPDAPDKRRRVTLKCEDCHKPDEAGNYMQPIRYESHCKQCHPLSVQLTGRFKGKEAEAAALEFASRPAPHPAPGQSAEVVRGALRDRLLELVRKHRLVAAEGDDLPGMPGPAGIGEGTWKAVRQELGEQEMRLFWGAQEKAVAGQLLEHSGGCVYCHFTTAPEGRPGQALPVFAKPNLPVRWQIHSHFSHQSHRTMKCIKCHAEAQTSKRTEDVLLPNKDVCAECHRPAGTAGARGDCVECHRYHPREGGG
jgi:hypothetical protein